VTACPICGANASFSPTASRNSDVDCPRCGPYRITHEALSALQGNFIRKVPIRWAITSHALRRTGSTPERRFLVQQSWLIAVWETDRLPNPQQQADYFIDYLGQSARAPDQWIACRPIEIAGLVGSGDDPTKGETSGFVYLADHLSAEHLISSRSSTAGGTVDYRLTFRGWSRFEDIRLARVDSNVAFMAMGYGNPVVDQAFSQFKTGISGIGVDLRRLDTKPKSGLIDLRMRVGCGSPSSSWPILRTKTVAPIGRPVSPRDAGRRSIIPARQRNSINSKPISILNTSLLSNGTWEIWRELSTN
jgi:hypothetical protein